MSESNKDVCSKTFTLNNGVLMPALGLGTYRMKTAQVVFKAVDNALAAGYRLFDTAAVYYNEEHLKLALRELLPKYGLSRKDIFITTKLAPADLKRPKEACLQSLKNLGVDYVDLYLIHFPGNKNKNISKEENIIHRQIAWNGLVQLYKAGMARAIGVSNYNNNQIEELLQNNCGVVPAVNQVEWHPYYYQVSLRGICNENGILLQAYSSLGTSANQVDSESVLYNETVTNVAKQLKVSNAQLLLAWALQQNVAIIPKSTNPRHIKENCLLNFVIPSSDTERLNSLVKANIKYAWNPDDM